MFHPTFLSSGLCRLFQQEYFAYFNHDVHKAEFDTEIFPITITPIFECRLAYMAPLNAIAI
jgi:hypothetical protein